MNFCVSPRVHEQSETVLIGSKEEQASLAQDMRNPASISDDGITGLEQLRISDDGSEEQQHEDSETEGK